MKLVRLTKEMNISKFNCGDKDLDAFLLEDAINFQEKHIANTFVLLDNDKVAAYFCLLNDKISRVEITNSRWKKIKDSFPDGKRFRSYPSIKIGRLAVSQDYKGRHLGTHVMNVIKSIVSSNSNPSAFRFLTVDAYLSAVGFYRECGFSELTQKDEDEHTRLMYFDMMSIE